MKQTQSKINTVAILGGGPVACTLAILLARTGVRVAIWHKPKVTQLIVGESLVPAVIPMLRKLGVEDQVRKSSTLKPGATFNLSDDTNFSFHFDQLRGLPRYAYNVPRDIFDATLLEAAQKAGAAVYEVPAQVIRVPGADRVELSPETLAEAKGFFTGPPDLIVDATGRLRLLPNLLEIPSQRGPRHDIALFAHVDQTHLDHEGHVHTTRLDRGWSWRIPLPGRVSLGMVVPEEHALKFGTTTEERYDNLLKSDSVLSKVAKDAKRVTPAVEFANYQLVSKRVVGDGWVLVGDTAGFVDPVFSSGMFLGMQGAFNLAETISHGTKAAFEDYEWQTIHHLEMWQEIAEYWYGGRLFTCFKVGEKLRDKWFVKLMFPHMNKHMGRIFGGAASNSAYSIGLLRFAMKYGLKDEDPRELMVR